MSIPQSGPVWPCLALSGLSLGYGSRITISPGLLTPAGGKCDATQLIIEIARGGHGQSWPLNGTVLNPETGFLMT